MIHLWICRITIDFTKRLLSQEKKFRESCRVINCHVTHIYLLLYLYLCHQKWSRSDCSSNFQPLSKWHWRDWSGVISYWITRGNVVPGSKIYTRRFYACYYHAIIIVEICQTSRLDINDCNYFNRVLCRHSYFSTTWRSRELPYSLWR